MSSTCQCFHGGVLQYEGGGRMGNKGMASAGTPTCKAAAVQGLLRDGILT